jgi:hypothetical protein
MSTGKEQGGKQQHVPSFQLHSGPTESSPCLFHKPCSSSALFCVTRFSQFDMDTCLGLLFSRLCLPRFQLHSFPRRPRRKCSLPADNSIPYWYCAPHEPFRSFLSEKSTAVESFRIINRRTSSICRKHIQLFLVIAQS